MSRGQQTLWIDELRRSYRRAMSRTTVESTVAAAARLLPLWLVLLAVGMLVTPTPALAWVLAGTAWLGALVVAGWAALRIGRHRRKILSFAAWLEAKAGLDENELVNALELERGPEPSDPLARHIVQRVVRRARETHGGLPVPSLVREINLAKPLAAGLGAVAVGALLFVLSPVAFHESVTALSAPATVVAPTITIQVHPGDVSLERGEDLAIRATVEAQAAVETASLIVRGADGVWRPHDMAPSGETSPSGEGRVARPFRYDLRDLQAGLTYLVTTGSHRSPEYRVEIREPLRALGYRKILDWPAYSRLPRQSEISAHGDLIALPGTDVTLQVSPSREGVEGRIVWSSGRETALTARDDGEVEGRWTVSRADTYRVVLEDELGGDWTSDPFIVSVLEDQPPVIRVLSPAGDTSVPADMQVLLDVECVDDYGLGDLVMVYSRAWEQPQRQALGRWADGTREARVTHPWDLGHIGLLPGQDLTFFFEISDNDDVSGPKVTRSPVFTIRFPSIAEMYSDLEEEREEDIRDLGEMLEEQERLQNDLAEISRELKKETELSWEKQQEVQKFVEEQKQLAEKLGAVSQSLDQSLENMEERSLFSPEMLEKLQQIQALVNEIQSDELHDYLEAMKEAVENLDREALQRAMEQFKFSQEEIRQGLDRTIELLERLLAEEKLGRLTQEVQRLAMEQKALNDQLEECMADSKAGEAEEPPEGGEGESPEDQAAESEDEGEPAEGEASETDSETAQSEEADSPDGERGESAEKEAGESRELSPEERAALEEEQKRLAEEAKRLQEMMDELKEMSREALQKLAEMLEDQMQEPNSMQKAQQNMQQAQESMSQSKPEQSLRFGRRAQENLQAMMASLQQMQAALEEGQTDEIIRQLFALSNELVHISRTQEDVLTDEGRYPTDQLAVEEQALLEGTEASLDSLFAIGRKTPILTMEQARTMGEAVRKMGEAVEFFEKGRRNPGVALARESAVALDDALRDLLDVQESMCKSGGSCSNPNNASLSQMQGLASQQSRLNKDTQTMMGMQGKRISASQSRQVMSLAARQEMIKKGLQEFSEQVGDQRDILGRLGDMAAEMEEIAREMRDRGVDERILRRQEKILSRLLTAQRSIRRQDQKEERISKPGESLGERMSPPPLPPQRTLREEIMRGILRGGQDPIPADYRQLVEEYYKALMASP